MNTKAALLLASLAAALATIFVFVPHNPTMVLIVLLTDGLCAALWTAGATALGAFILKKIKIQADFLLFLTTAAALGLGIFSLLALGLGLLGLLNQATSLAMPITGAILFLADLLQKEKQRGREKQEKQRGRESLIAITWLKSPVGINWLWLIPVISLTIAAIAASVMPGVLWRPFDPDQYDVVSYHLQVPREWYEAGKILPLSHNVFSFFPMNVEMQYLSLMHAFGGPWRAMYICQFTNVAYAALLIIALASEGGILRAALASTIPWLIMLASVAYVESALMLYTALALIWALRGNTKGTVIAALMTGLAAGVKITAVPMLMLPILLAILAMRQKGSLVRCAIFAVITLLILSPWLLRNFFWATNPLFPIAMNLLGRAHFTIEQVARFRQAHSPTPTQQSLTARLTILWTDVITHWQFGFILFPVAAFAVITNLKSRRTQSLLSAAAVILIVWIGFTHLIPRFLVQLIPLAALLIGSIPVRKFQLSLVLIALLAAPLGWLNIFTPLTRITADPIRSALIGREDLSFMIPDTLADMKDTQKQIALIGDAGAFLYQIPMSRLHYKTVFDLPANTTDPIQAWAGEEAKNNPNWILVINPTEIARLHKTYLDVPPLPPQWSARGDQPFILNATDANASQ
jgi:hypothetical protein